MIDKQWIDGTWDKIDKKLARIAVSAYEKLPYTTVNGIYDDKHENNADWWTNGFWPGMMWLMYDATKNEKYKITAERAEVLLDKALYDAKKTHHDVGFMWHISSGANYRLTGNKDSLKRNLIAANLLAGRYNIKGGFIRAWNDSWEGLDTSGWAIIDCMMNIPLLYWASKEIGDPRYTYIAMSHADKTLKHHVRDDGSVNHIVEYDIENGEIRNVYRGQGYADDSSWSRGQAWALYGFTLSYIHTKEKRYLDTAKKVANYFISAVCKDWLPRCDFRSPLEPVIYDTSAGLIAANGLIELSRVVSEYESQMYYSAALNLIEAITIRFADFSDKTDAIITYGTEAYHYGNKHINMIYSDFYFVEAMNKLKGFNTFLW